MFRDAAIVSSASTAEMRGSLAEIFVRFLAISMVVQGWGTTFRAMISATGSRTMTITWAVMPSSCRQLAGTVTIDELSANAHLVGSA